MDGKITLLLCFSILAAAAKHPLQHQQVHQQVRVAVDQPAPDHAPAGPAGRHAPADQDGVPRADLEELKQLRAMLMDQQVKLTAQEEKLTKQQSKITEHEVKLTEQLQEITALKAEPSTADDTCRRSITNYIDKAVASAHNKNEDRSTGAAQQVAFTAYNDWTRLYSTYDRIDFDGVVTNVGGHFDNSSTFTCPVDGLYFFSFSVMGDYSYSDTAYVTLRREGSVIVGAYADYYLNDPQSSNTAVMRCGAGEEVYLRSESYTYMHSDSDRQVTFSGFLISEN